MDNIIIIPYIKNVRIIDECLICAKKHCQVETNCNHSFCYDCFKESNLKNCLVCDKEIKYLQPIGI